MQNGRYIIDEPTDLADGTELYLVPATEAEALVEPRSWDPESTRSELAWADMKAELGIY